MNQFLIGALVGLILSGALFNFLATDIHDNRADVIQECNEVVEELTFNFGECNNEKWCK